MWLEEKGRDNAFSKPCSGVFTKYEVNEEALKGFHYRSEMAINLGRK